MVRDPDRRSRPETSAVSRRWAPVEHAESAGWAGVEPRPVERRHRPARQPRREVVPVKRVRAAALAALVVVLSPSAIAIASPAPPDRSVASSAVTWPVSAALLLAEVQTGGSSASDEFVEITNASASPVDLVGLEVAYVTSSGGTITRKATWSA